MTDPLLPPNDPDPACRCCRTDLPLDGHGFCAACSARLVPVSHLWRGVAIDFGFVVFDDRVRPFLLGVVAIVPRRAEEAFGCADLPALEEGVADLWRSSERFRTELFIGLSERAPARSRSVPTTHTSTVEV